MSLWSVSCLLGIIFVFWLFFYAGRDTLKEDLCEIFLGFLIPLVGIRHYTIKYIQLNNSEIKREWKLLDALSKDFQIAYTSVKEIKDRANQVWESEVLNLRRITQALNEVEARWVRETGDLLFEAGRCTEEFKRGDLNYSVLALVRLKPWLLKHLALAFGMRRAMKAIHKYRTGRGREYASESVRFLEESRVSVRRLQHRPIDQTGHHQQRISIGRSQPFRSGLALVLGRLATSDLGFSRGTEEQIRAVVVQLQLLRALVKDLRGVMLESEMEKAWLDEANEIVYKSQTDINAFLQEAACQIWWMSLATDYWRYRPKFKKVMENLSELLTHLLETKERYGFHFIKRGLPSDADFNHDLLRMDSGNGDDSIGVILSTIIANLREPQDQDLVDPDPGVQEPRRRLNPKELQDVDEVLKELENLRGLLRDREATDSATYTSVACFNILKKMYLEVEHCVINLRLKEARRIRDTAGLLRRCIEVYRIKVIRETCRVVGLEEDELTLVSVLTDPRDRPQGQPVISIVGMRGVGKTTLAKQICNYKKVVNHFAVRCLASVPEETNEIGLLQSVGNQIMQTDDARNDKEFWISKLQGYLRDKKILVVLDDLSSREAWDILRPALFPSNSRSTIMVITQDNEVSLYANPTFIHRHQLRTAKESWEFFTQMVDSPPDQDLEMLAKKVLARTGGLPLAILRLGYLLSGRVVTRDELLVVQERVSQGQNQRPWEDNLETNRGDLQRQSVLENCLSYFQLFPRDFEIPKRRLVAMWVALGIIIIPTHSGENTPNELETAEMEEKAACDCLQDLIDRNMIQVVERKHNGKALTCRFPSILKERWLRGRRSATRSWSLCASIGQQVAYRFDDDEDGSYSRVIHNLRANVLREDNYPLSVTFFDSREGDRPGEDVRNFLVQGIASGNFRGLLVLDLESVFRPNLPSNIGKLKQLKYLGLRWTYLETLPSSIGQLSNLQTLDLKKTNLRTLPSSVWKLKKLRHLHLNQCRIEVMPDPRDISMKNLRKLSGVFVDDESRALISSLHKLSNLQKLRLTFQLTGPQQEVLARAIPDLTHLRSLSLRSVNQENEAQNLKLEHISRLVNLSSMYLFGKLESLCILCEPPQSLVELTLSSSELLRGSLLLQMLADLPNLKYLNFLARSYVDNELVFSTGGFPKLLVLKIWGLDNLNRFNVEETAMPGLKELEIRDCRNLTVTSPDITGFTHLTTLKELRLTGMPQAFTRLVKEEFARARVHNQERIAFPTIKINDLQQLPVQ